MSSGGLVVVAAFSAGMYYCGPPQSAIGRIKPAVIRLTSGDHTLQDIIKAVNEQGPNRVELDPGPSSFGAPLKESAMLKPEAKQERLVIGGGERTFWATIDQICLGSKRRPTIQTSGQPRVVLVPASHEPGHVSGEGVVRVALAGLHYARGVQFVPAIPKPSGAARGQYSRREAGRLHVEMDVMIEPRLKIVRVDGVSILAVEDDRGQSLLIHAAAQTSSFNALRPGPNGVPALFRLLCPDEPGGFIRRIKGSVSLIVVEIVHRQQFSHSFNVDFEFTNVPIP